VTIAIFGDEAMKCPPYSQKIRPGRRPDPQIIDLRMLMINPGDRWLSLRRWRNAVATEDVAHRLVG
jgi:hypothetical protein